MTLKAWIAGMVTTAAAMTALAAEPGWDPDSMATARVAEQEALALHDWRVRVDVQVGRDMVLRQIRDMKHDVEGKLRAEVASERSPDPQRRLTDPDRLPDVLAARRWLGEIDAMVRAYLGVPRLAQVEFFGRASVQPGPARLPGTTQVDGKGYLKAGDHVTWWLDSGSGRAVRLEIQSMLKEDDVHIVVDFGSGPDHVVYMSSVFGEIPSRKLRAQFHSFAFSRIGS